MRILVTGGAGFIGSITTRALLDRGHDCVVLDTLENGWRDAVDGRAEFVRGSVGDPAVLASVVPGCDAVMHLAGYIEVGESQTNPRRYFENNTERPKALLEAMVAAGVEAFVFSSTAAVYGEPESVPITEDARTLPVNAYGDSKLQFEQVLDDFTNRGIRSIRFRYFNVAGAWPDGSMGEAHDPETHLIPRVLCALRDGQERFQVFGGDYPTADGTCVRDYIHVCDLANAHAIALEGLHAGAAGGVFNLGNGAGFSNLEVVRACGRAVGRNLAIEIAPRRVGDPATLVASAEKAALELGWFPESPELERIVEDAWRWHLAHPAGYR